MEQCHKNIENVRMKTIKHFFIRLFTIFTISSLITACEKRSDYKNAIDNKTNDTISIFLKGTSAYVSGTDTIIAFPNRQTVYYSAEGWRIRNKNHDCDPQLATSETTIVVSGGKTIKKDLTKKENWNCETDKDNTYWIMIFKINNEDLQ